MTRTISIHENTNGTVTLRLYKNGQEVDKETGEFHQVEGMIDHLDATHDLPGTTIIHDFTGPEEKYSLTAFHDYIRIRFN